MADRNLATPLVSGSENGDGPKYWYEHESLFTASPENIKWFYMILLIKYQAYSKFIYFL